MSNRHVELAIEITAHAAAAAVFDEVGDSADRMASDVDSAARKMDAATPRMDSVAESADGVASKGSQAAGALSGLGDLVGGKFGSAMVVGGVAMQGFADAGDLVNVVTESTIVKKTKDIIVTKAQRAATIATTAATKGAAIAQRLLNAAMRANPIGLVITALTLLVGGFILAYKKSETFRTIVNKVMDAARTAVGWVVDKVQALVDKVKGPLTNVWDGIKGAVRKVADFVKPIIDSISNTVDWLVGKWKNLVDWIERAVSKAGSIKTGAGAGFSLGSILPGAGFGRVALPGTDSRPVTVNTTLNLNGTILDRAGTSRDVQQLLDEHALRLGKQLAIG